MSFNDLEKERPLVEGEMVYIEKKKSQGEEREESQGCFMFCEAHLSVL